MGRPRSRRAGQRRAARPAEVRPARPARPRRHQPAAARARGDDPVTATGPEAVFQDQVIEIAHIYRWRVAHFRPAQTSRGWRTPVAADGMGFPDLVLIRQPEMIIAEL